MRIIMLGTGAALVDPDRNHSSILVTTGGRHYLLDCGHGATHQLVRAGIDPTDVDIVFLSHLHFDHIADFPYFMLSTWIFGRQRTPTVIGPPETDRFVQHLFAKGAFAKDIEARAQYPQRQKNFHVLEPVVRACQPGLVYEDDLVRVQACYVEHIPREISPCFGLRIDAKEGKSVVFSGDTAPCERLVELARDCDLLIHECTFPQRAIEFRSKAGIGTWAHTSPLDLGQIAVRSRARALVATHFGHFDTTNVVLKKHLAAHMPLELVGPEFMEDVVTDIRRSYAGPLHVARDLMRIDL
ncbi:MAG TPA: MBL fold metallo-hydrolase [Stellaceae bacterium]|nr:MBL fold metallo-hydrolase [Stellaceae bacterium]